MVLGEIVNDTKEKEVVTSNSNVEDQVLEENNNSIEPRKFRVLIVDDQSFTRFVHQAKVTKLGLESELAENGKQAVDLHRAGASFDLILMDRDMPVMNGVEATRELRAMGVETMIVGVTAHVDGPQRQDFIEAGLNACYTKPISPKDIATLVELVNEKKAKAQDVANNI